MNKYKLNENIKCENMSFSETQIETKYGIFTIRVYLDTTVVLWKDFDKNSPVLVRVHSECLTGDLFGSFRCDCGEQLEKSLEMINKKGGVFIYLRQEGRGIGLFEKIKAYTIQKQGYDTFQANVMLGHLPDQRTYEMAAKALFDLDIDKIELVTNNPSKVTALASLGIDVVKQHPIPVKANKYNKCYLEAKKLKFQHQYQSPLKHYLYQFHLESPAQVFKVKKMIERKKLDPLLIIAVGINVNILDLKNPKKLDHIKALCASCKQIDFTPIIHLSFKKQPESSYLPILMELKNTCPWIKNIHLNDMEKMTSFHIQKAAELFSITVPLSDDNFHLIHEKKFQNLVKQHNISLFLDNSKGKGIKESKSSFMKKIDLLIQYGLNSIGLCGGFGPTQLSSYFFLKKYYKINFSIDAETGLKTSGQVDLEKVEDYLTELMHSSLKPKKEKIKQTKKLLESSKIDRKKWSEVTIQSHKFQVNPKVFHPKFFPSTAWFAKELLKQLTGRYDFCEVGCGSGVISCLIALSHREINVTATDICPDASENTKANATRLGVSDQIKVYNGNVLASLEKNCLFDYIFWALPFGYLDPEDAISLEEAQVFDPGYRATEKFLKSAKRHLKKNGKLLLGFSKDLGHHNLLHKLAAEKGIVLKTLASTELKETETVQFEILEGQYQSPIASLIL